MCMSCLCRVLPNGGGNLCTQIYDQVNFKGAKSRQRAEQSRGPEAPAQPEPQVVVPALCSQLHAPGFVLPAPCSWVCSMLLTPCSWLRGPGAVLWLCVPRSMCPALFCAPGSMLLAPCSQLCALGFVLLALCAQLCVPGRAGCPDSKVQLSCSRALQKTSLSIEWIKHFGSISLSFFRINLKQAL